MFIPGDAVSLSLRGGGSEEGFMGRGIGPVVVIVAGGRGIGPPPPTTGRTPPDMPTNKSASPAPLSGLFVEGEEVNNSVYSRCLYLGGN